MLSAASARTHQEDLDLLFQLLRTRSSDTSSSWMKRESLARRDRVWQGLSYISYALGHIRPSEAHSIPRFYPIYPSGIALPSQPQVSFSPYNNPPGERWWRTSCWKNWKHQGLNLATHSGCPIAWHATETWSDNSKSPGGCTIHNCCCSTCAHDTLRGAISIPFNISEK